MTQTILGEDDRDTVRFIKVNLIKDNVNSVIEKFQDEGWEKLETAASYEGYLEQLSGLEPFSQVLLQDFHVPEVLVFPPGTELHENELYTNGSIFFMNKASCLAPLLLAPDRSSHVLDMCAAPGLKTIQLASYVPKGKVYAVERDPERYKYLEQFLAQSCADNVTPILQDVTKLDIDKYKHVEYILLDPSCTGSGMQKRLPSTSFKARMDEKTRLAKLSGFQLTLLRFALTRFPAAKRVVYSTCSLNVEENEEVVKAALNSYYHNFDLVSVKDKLPGWQSFGSKDFEFGHKCIYCRTETDCTNGFFVAVFERKKMESDISYENIENPKENSKKQNKLYKKRVQEYNNDYENEGSTASPQKRLRLEFNEIERRKENKLVDTNNFDKSESQKEKKNVKKLSVSEKKRSRKTRLKNLLKTNKDKSPKVKLTNQGSDRSIDKSLRKKNDTKILKTDSLTNDKITRAKLRRKRSMVLKTGLISKTDESTIQKLRNLETTGKISTKLKKKRIQRFSQENLNEQCVKDILPVKMKEKKKENILEETVEVDNNKTVEAEQPKHNMKSVESTSPRKKTNVLSESIETIIDSRNSLKKKHKKKHYLEDSDAKVAKANVSEQNVEDIITKDNENGETEPYKKKKKKKRSLDNCDNNITSEVNVDNNFDRVTNDDANEENTKQSSLKNDGESVDGNLNKKKHKKKRSLDHQEDNVPGKLNVGENLGSVTNEDISDKNTKESPLKNYGESIDGNHNKKKHKKKRSLDHHEDNVPGKLNIGENLDSVTNEDISDKNTKESPLKNDVGCVDGSPIKRKHKKKSKDLDQNKVNNL